MLEKILNSSPENGLDKLYYILKYGLPRRKSNIFQLRRENFPLEKVVFFLSTGRCGTTWFTRLLEYDKKVKVMHDPKPNLHIQGKIAYEVLEKNHYCLNTDTEKLLTEMFLSGREELLKHIYKAKKGYIETNNHITFFAPILAKLFPQALFVHLFRHPVEFIKSGLRRNYYSKNDNMIEKRLIPHNLTFTEWNKYSQAEKIALLWNETNNFIESFKATIPSKRIYNFNFNYLDLTEVQNLLNFLEIDVPTYKINKMLGKKINAQQSSKADSNPIWDVAMKNKVIPIYSKLAEKYNYQF